MPFVLDTLGLEKVRVDWDESFALCNEMWLLVCHHHLVWFVFSKVGKGALR